MQVKVTVLCKASYDDVIEVPDDIDPVFIPTYCHDHLPELGVNHLTFLEDIDRDQIISCEIVDDWCDDTNDVFAPDDLRMSKMIEMLQDCIAYNGIIDPEARAAFERRREALKANFPSAPDGFWKRIPLMYDDVSVFRDFEDAYGDYLKGLAIYNELPRD